MAKLTLAQEWDAISRAMYGENFVDEIAAFLIEQKVEAIYEAGCGGGHILQGLAKRRFSGVGIDGSSEMIEIAREKSKHPNIDFEVADWMEYRPTFSPDVVMCRGNSLAYAASWDEESSDGAKEKLLASLDVFSGLVGKEKLFYVDTIKAQEFESGGGGIDLVLPGIELHGQVRHDLEAKTRTIGGSGVVYGDTYEGESVSYLLHPEELKGLLRFVGFKEVMPVELNNEINYEVFIARK